MTKKLEEFFNLPSSADDTTPDVAEVSVVPVAELKQQLYDDARSAMSAMSAMTTTEKVETALPLVSGLDSHDSEMESIAKKAIQTFEDLVSLGNNVPDMHAGKIYEVAGQMLKTAMEAHNAKAEKKLRMVELQLKKLRAEQIDLELGNGPAKTGNGVEFDRNELLRHIVKVKSQE